MGLDDFKTEEASTEQTEQQEDLPSGTHYQEINQQEFEEFLDSLPWDFEETKVMGTFERVYDHYGILGGSERFSLRIYSTIEVRTGEGRDKGDDAIRTVIWDHRLDAPIGGRTKTLRIGPSQSNPEGWKGNLRPKIESLIEQTDDWLIMCNECGGFLVPRSGQYGEFLGCSNYPFCKNKADIEVWENTKSLRS